mgnify:CR=1 FL=1
MFTDIDKNLVNGENMGGIAQYIYYGLHSDVEDWPTKPASPTTLAENGALTGDIVMKTGKKLNKLYITDDTGEFRIEPVGSPDGMSFILHLLFFHPGLNKDILGLINKAKNENMVFIVPDNNGAKFLMGDQLRPATFAGPGDGQGSGKETAARRGMGAEFTYKTANVYQYVGSVPLTEAGS